MVCAVAALAFYYRRKSKVILAAIVYSFALSIMGFIGTVQVNLCFMFVHSFFCCSVLGAFFVYILIDTLMKEEEDGKASLSDNAVLLILSLPFLLIFLIGCHSLYLTDMLYDEYKARKLESKQQEEQFSFSVANQQNQQDFFNRQESVGQQSDVKRNKPSCEEIELLVIPEESKNTNLCVICMEKPKNCIFYPCGHECCCLECGKQFHAQAVHKLCPICRNRIKDIVKVFR